MKRRVTRITKTRMRTNLLSRYADAPTPNATRVALTRRAFGDMFRLRYAFCAPHLYSKLPMLCEVQSTLPSEDTRRNFLFCVRVQRNSLFCVCLRDAFCSPRLYAKLSMLCAFRAYTLRGYATQLSALRVHATQLIFHCHMHREGRDHSSNAEAVDVQLVDAQAVVEQGRKVGVVVRKFSNGFIIKTIVFHPRIRIPRIPGISFMLRGLLQRETETNEGFSLKILMFHYKY